MIAGSGLSRADFLSGAGEMGRRIREFDWARTPVGPIGSWPQSLKTSVSLILGSRHPMWIGWGPEMTFLYNDPYLHVLGPAKHPSALGSPAVKVWAEIWDFCGPLAERVFERGEATFADDVRLLMDRGDYLEETFYSFSYSPIRDERGCVAGLFCPSTDVTPRVLNARRLRTLSELAANSLVEKTTAGACATAGRIMSKNADDIPFALLYLADADEKWATLEQAVGHFGSEPAMAVELEGAATEFPWPIAQVFQTAERRIVRAEHVSQLPAGAEGHAVAEAVVLPVASQREHRPYGVLVAGVNPHRRLDADHITFFDLIAGQVQLIFASAPTAVPQIKAGKIRALAVTTLKRSAVLPDLPTMAESGLPGFESDNWYGIVTAMGTPRPVIDKLNAELVRALQSPDTRQVLFIQGLEVKTSTPEEFGAYMKSEYVKWAKVIRDAGLYAN